MERDKGKMMRNCFLRGKRAFLFLREISTLAEGGKNERKLKDKSVNETLDKLLLLL